MNKNTSIGITPEECLELRPCCRCGQIDVGQTGEYPCPLCGLPTLWDESDVRERLAQYAHEAWCGWMNYMFSKGIFHDDGTFTLEAWAAERWRRQSVTSYHALPENEKESDRAEADKILEIVK